MLSHFIKDKAQTWNQDYALECHLCSGPHQLTNSSWAILSVFTGTKPNFQFCEHTELWLASWALLFLEVSYWSSHVNFILSRRTPDPSPVTHHQSPSLPVRPPHFCLSKNINRNFVCSFPLGFKFNKCVHSGLVQCLYQKIT